VRIPELRRDRRMVTTNVGCRHLDTGEAAPIAPTCSSCPPCLHQRGVHFAPSCIVLYTHLLRGTVSRYFCTISHAAFFSPSKKSFTAFTKSVPAAFRILFVVDVTVVACPPSSPFVFPEYRVRVFDLLL
jgi:hypothetical protein